MHLGRHDIQHNDTQYYDTQNYDTQHYDTQHYDTQHYNNQHYDNQHLRHSAQQRLMLKFIVTNFPFRFKEEKKINEKKILQRRICF
jgi:hypothetical protein